MSVQLIGLTSTCEDEKKIGDRENHSSCQHSFFGDSAYLPIQRG